jgi:gliding motility-associated-like protein
LVQKHGFYIIFLLVVTCFALQRTAIAQESYQFLENKGQWDPAVQYRSQIPGGYIYLRKDGFTYALLDARDMTDLDNYFHGASYKSDSSAGSGIYIPIIGNNNNKSASLNRSTAAANNRTGTGKVIHAYAYRVNFLGAATGVQLIPDHASTSRYNYLIGNDSSKWGRNIKAYDGITYKNLYSHIDARVYAQSSGLKYDLIAYPGSRPEADIRLQYEGVEKLKLKNGHLHVYTSLGEIIEVAPYAYQAIGDTRVEIPCKYKLEGNVLSFKISGKYNSEYPLVIDPRLIFATFSGSTSDNWGYTATYDAQGNFYMGGIVFGTGYPVTTGAYQVNFENGPAGGPYGAGFDMSISKFSPDGRNLIYATYLGGKGNEQPQSLIVNSSGNLIVAGRTSDGSTYPHTGTSGPGGDWDIVLTELNAAGSGLVGSLVIGGGGADGVNIADKYDTGPTRGAFTYSLRRFYGDDARSEVNIDGAGNVVLVGCTQSTGASARFPVTGGAFQPNPGGMQDAIVLKAAPDLSRVIWSSFLGGSANDAAYVVNFSNNGNLYVAGGTESSNFPGNMSNVIQSRDSGKVDGFIAEIKDDGSAIVRSTYLGTPQADQIYGIQSDKEGNVYVGGTTEGVWRVTDNGKYDGFNTYGKYGKQFLCKLKPDLSGYVYSTTFGSSNSQPASLPNISPTAFLVDRCENVYMAGWGGNIQPDNTNEYPNAGTNNLPVVNAINPRPPDGRDFYFFVLKKDAERILFASTYGQNGGFTDHVDGGTSRFDPTGIIYEAICGNCGGGTLFPTGPPGVYSRQNGSRKPGNSNVAGCNVIGLKIAFDLDGVRGGVASLDRRKIYCNDEQVSFIDTLYNRKAYQWIWDVFNTCNISQINGMTPVATVIQDTTMDKPYLFNYQFGQAGCYTVRLIKYMPNDCIERDTSYVNVRIGDNPAILKVEAHKLRPCNSYRYEFDNFSSNAKNIPFGDSAFVWSFGDGSVPVITKQDTSIIHQFPGEGNYTVTLTLRDTANFCNAPLDTSIVISISNQLKAIIQAPDTVCIPDQYLLGNASLGGTNFDWVVETPGGVIDTFHKGDLSQLPYDFSEPGIYRIELYAQDTVCGTKDYTVDTVFAYPKPTAAFSFSPDNGTNQVITFTNQSVSNFEQVDDHLTYYWNFGDGSTSAEKDPRHLYPQTGSYHVELITYNRAGCADTTSQDLTTTIIPKMDVPNAFTPNGDGLNDYISPIAFGVTQIDFRIYNRWGQMVFRSNDPQITYMQNKGWDGRFNGKPQEMDVYAYTLHVVFNDGKEATKQGSITLIR